MIFFAYNMTDRSYFDTIFGRETIFKHNKTPINL